MIISVFDKQYFHKEQVSAVPTKSNFGSYFVYLFIGNLDDRKFFIKIEKFLQRRLQLLCVSFVGLFGPGRGMHSTECNRSYLWFILRI